jgi:hypothetical protein
MAGLLTINPVSRPHFLDPENADRFPRKGSNRLFHAGTLTLAGSCALFASLPVIGQTGTTEPGVASPMMMYFGPKVYRAHPTNHAVHQAPNGLVYVANENGLMEFDGRSWQRIGESHLVFDLDIEKGNRIWTSGFRRFGWMELNEDFEWVQHDLYRETERFGSVESEFRNVEAGKDAVYFAAHNTLYRYRDAEGLTRLVEGHFIRNLHRIGDEVYVVGADSNFHRISEDGIERVLEEEVFWGPDQIRASGILSGNRLAFMTTGNGMRIWDGKQLTHHPAFATHFPRTHPDHRHFRFQ